LPVQKDYIYPFMSMHAHEHPLKFASARMQALLHLLGFRASFKTFWLWNKQIKKQCQPAITIILW